jgi:predicted RNA-binding protein with PIN domain
MPLHYFIDGYNVIMSADWLAAGALRDRRERLLKFIEEKRPQGGAANRVTVVFDGREDVSGPAWAGPTRVVFSRGPDADSVIKDEVDHLPNPREAVVVTNDKPLQAWVRGAGARVLPCAEFLAAARGPAKPASSPPELDPESARDINEEMRKFWKLK